MAELVQFNRILVRDGVLGGSNGALYGQWNPNSPMYSPEISQRYPGDHKMRAVTKVARTQKSGRVGKFTEKDFAIAKKKRRICEDITTLCFHAEKSGFVKKPLKCVWCGLDTYFVCKVCLDSNKNPIPLHLNTLRGNGIGKQCFFKWHDENHFGLGKNDRSKALKLPKHQWKEPAQREIRENTDKISNLN